MDSQIQVFSRALSARQVGPVTLTHPLMQAILMPVLGGCVEHVVDSQIQGFPQGLSTRQVEKATQTHPFRQAMLMSCAEWKARSKVFLEDSPRGRFRKKSGSDPPRQAGHVEQLCGAVLNTL